MDNKVMFSSKTDEWRTPKEVIDYAHIILGKIDLDPCSCANSLVPAGQAYIKKDNGLTQQWNARTVFINFPYSQAKQWASKILVESVFGNKEILVLSAARTDTRWFHTLASQASALLFFKGRVGFLPESGETSTKAPFPSVFIYLGNNPKKFEKLRHLGLVVYP